MENSELWRFTRLRIRDVEAPEGLLESASTKTYGVKTSKLYAGARLRLRKCRTDQVSCLMISGFAVGKILVDHGLEIAG